MLMFKTSAMGKSEITFTPVGPIVVCQGNGAKWIVSRKDFINAPWLTVFEGEDPPKVDPPKVDPPKVDPPKVDPPVTPPSFTQDQVNTMLAKQKREHQVSTQKTIDELKAQQTSLDLNDEERTRLDTTIQDLQNQILTKEEQVRRASEKSKKDYDEKLEVSDKKYGDLFTTYQESETERAITDAASKGKDSAYQPSQIVAILKPMTRFVAKLDADDKPTGKYKTVIDFPGEDKDGKAVTLNLTATEAVTRMKEMDDYFNLFENAGTGGVGSTNRSKGKGKGDPAELARTDTAEYIKQRRAGKIDKPGT